MLFIEEKLKYINIYSFIEKCNKNFELNTINKYEK